MFLIDSHIHWHFNNLDKKRQVKMLQNEIKKNLIDKCILYLIDKNDYANENYKLQFGENIIPAIALDPRGSDINSKLYKVKQAGIRILKLLPYEQAILYEDYPIVCEYAKKIQDMNMYLTICGSYGSKYIYDTNGVELAATLLKSGFKNPLIIAHAGMTKILDVHSLLCEYNNLYVDISFTIKYWWNSHIIDDLYFTLQKVNFDRAFYGSDYPSYSFDEAIKYFYLFCEKYELNELNKNKLLNNNFEKFYKDYLGK